MQREFSFRGLTKPDKKTVDLPLNAEGNAYLHELCFHGAPADLVREAVLSLGANVQLLNKNNLPPLGLAMLAGNLELVQCLIDLGAELYFSSPSGQVFNAALTAVFSGREDVLALILKNGGGLHVNAPGSDLSCLALAVKRGNYELIDQLAAAGAFVDRESGEKNLAPLHIAAMGRSESIEKLLRLGAKIEKRQSPSGMTALHYAVSDRNYGAVACLLKQGADPNALTAEGMSPLMLSDSPSITSLLITAKADVNYRRGTGTKETALHIAAARDESDMVLALLKAGADPLLTNAFNQTAGRLARESGNRYVAGRLEDAERQAEREVFEKAFKKFKRQ